jgi:hypothetical protein
MIPGEFEKILRSKGKFDPHTTRLMLMEAYDIDYGIANHELEMYQGPLNLVKMYPKEDPVSYSRRYETIRRYHIYRIQDHFGFNLKEFLDQPREYVDFMLRLGGEYATAGARAQTDALRAAEELGNGKPGKSS